MTYKGPVGHILACDDSERIIVELGLRNETHFLLLQAKQATACAFGFVNGDCVLVVVPLGFVIRKTL